MRKNVASCWTVILLLAVSAVLGFDGNGEKSAAKTEKPGKESAKLPVTPEMESAAMQFVETNHGELVELLQQMKTTNPAQYQQAMRDLSRAATTLATTQKNDPRKYELDLKAWKVNSQIQVIVARLAMSQTPELKEELRTKLFEQIQLRLDRQRLERERTETRLKKLDESIAKLEGTREEEVAKAFAKFTRTTVKPGPKNDSKPTRTETKGGAQDNPASTPTK
jgi:hypothetical protein